MGIKRPREILNEVTKLKMFEITTKIVKFLKEEYGLVATVEATRPDEFIDIYLSNFKHADDIEVELPDDKISKAILKMFNDIHKDEELKAINVWPTEFGYTIVLDSEVDSDAMTENVLYYYYYNKNNNTEENNENENLDMRKPLKEAKEDEEEMLRSLLNKGADETTSKEEKPSEEEPEQPREEIDKPQDEFDKDDINADEIKPDKKDSEQDISNTVLDNRFIWFFVVLDKDAEELTEEIENLDEAIDRLVENERATMLVAYPYIDPNPEDENVDLVFADNPGPIIVYDGEEE